MDELFCQIFVVGPATPGARITVFVSGPSGSEVFLYLAAAVLVQPVSTPWGNLGLEFPITQVVQMGAIPSGGMASTTLTVPPSAVVGEVAFALQAMVGAQLTNSLEVVVE